MRILLLEPFYGGSHRQLIDYFYKEVFDGGEQDHVELYSMPAKKWHWRARTGALYFAEKVAEDRHFDVLFCSSVLSLAELLGLRPDLAAIPKKIVYFHENQLVYPVRGETAKARDFQYGYNQVTTALAADKVVFNSRFNLTSFLDNISKHFGLQPDFRPAKDSLRSRIERKSSVIYFPVEIPREFSCILDSEKREGQTFQKSDKGDVLRIVWPHRWEHDKNPEDFFRVLISLKNEAGCRFEVSVLGETYSEQPPIFETARAELSPEYVRHWGYLPTKADYWRHLAESHVVVSTADHEFFGVSTLEAVAVGCYPLLPNRLVYPELYPKDCLYNTSQQLLKRLKNFAQKPRKVPDGRDVVDVREKLSRLRSEYRLLFSLQNPIYVKSRTCQRQSN